MLDHSNTSAQATGIHYIIYILSDHQTSLEKKIENLLYVRHFTKYITILQPKSKQII